jgi:hypothetical protein
MEALYYRVRIYLPDYQAPRSNYRSDLARAPVFE